MPDRASGRRSQCRIAGNTLVRVGAAKMEKAQVYPEGMWITDGVQALNYLLEHYSHLQNFYADAAAHGKAVICFIS